MAFPRGLVILVAVLQLLLQPVEGAGDAASAGTATMQQISLMSGKLFSSEIILFFNRDAEAMM